MAKDMTSIRYGRLTEIMQLLEEKTSVTREELYRAGEYSSRRTLQNDLRYLRETWGAVISYDPKTGRYILDEPGTFLINLKITRKEAEALTCGLKTASHFLPHLQEPAKIFDSLLDAIRSRHAVIIRYKSPGKDARKWVISPYNLYFRGSSWYLVGCNHAFKSLNIYRAGRIQGVRPSDDAYIKPEESGYSEEYISSAWYVTPGKELHRIKLRVSGYIAESVRELEIHPTQKLEQCEDGGVILTAEVPSLEEAGRWVMAGAPGVSVLEPEGLREIVNDYCKQILTEEDG